MTTQPTEMMILSAIKMINVAKDDIICGYRCTALDDLDSALMYLTSESGD